MNDFILFYNLFYRRCIYIYLDFCIIENLLKGYTNRLKLSIPNRKLLVSFLYNCLSLLKLLVIKRYNHHRSPGAPPLGKVFASFSPSCSRVRAWYAFFSLLLLNPSLTFITVLTTLHCNCVFTCLSCPLNCVCLESWTMS